MQAIVTAGGTLKADNPLFIETGIATKALLPMGGKPMIQWIVEALLDSKYIDGVVIVGLKPGDFDADSLPVRYTETQGNIVDNVLAGMKIVQEINPNVEKVILCSSDIPLLTSNLVNEFVEICQETDHEIYYPVVEQKVMEKRFPNSKRTFTPMKGGRYTGGDIFLVHKTALKVNMELLRALTGQRKNFFAQARMVGFGFIFRFIFRMMDLDEAAERAGKVLNLNGRALDYPRAEVAMDVDKLHQYILVKNELEATLA